MEDVQKILDDAKGLFGPGVKLEIIENNKSFGLVASRSDQKGKSIFLPLVLDGRDRERVRSEMASNFYAEYADLELSEEMRSEMDMLLSDPGSAEYVRSGGNPEWEYIRVRMPRS